MSNIEKFDELEDNAKKNKLDLNWAKFEDAKSEVKEKFKTINGVDLERLESMFSIADKVFAFYYEGRENVIVGAPTGFGKSFLAFYVTEVIRLMGSTSYILTPNKFLQEQYDKDMKEKKFENMAMLKGQNNYTCTVNNQKISKRACEDDSINDVANGKNGMYAKWPCASSCVYMTTRLKAVESPITILNAQYWLTAMHLVLPMLGDRAPFQVRPLTVFDEAHTIGSIVQQMFSVDFCLNDFVRKGLTIGKIIEFNYRVQDNEFNDIWQFINVVNAQISLSNEYAFHKDLQMSDFSTVYASFKTLVSSIIDIQDKLSVYLHRVVNDILADHPGISTQQIKKYASADQNAILEYGKYTHTLAQNLTKISGFYNELGIKSMAITSKKLDTKEYAEIQEFGEASTIKMSFNCANESGIVKHAALANSYFGLFMSATFGNIDDFAKQTGITNYGVVDVPQVFDYSKSPILMVTPPISMNYKNKKENMETMIFRLIDLIDSRPNRRGLIHTGNYEIMKMLQAQKHPRVLCYTNAAEKTQIVSLLRSKPDIVIAGPSLVEGVDLKDDLCRFMLFCKVPYQSLADELVKRKMMIYENWYNWFTMSQIEQGCGRGVRNFNDWCETMFLDAGFESFFGRYSPPEYMENRLQEMHISDVLKFDIAQMHQELLLESNNTEDDVDYDDENYDDLSY